VTGSFAILETTTTKEKEPQKVKSAGIAEPPEEAPGGQDQPQLAEISVD